MALAVIIITILLEPHNLEFDEIQSNGSYCSDKSRDDLFEHLTTDHFLRSIGPGQFTKIPESAFARSLLN